MSDEPIEGVLGSLPRTRPHRRSAKRGPAAEPATPAAAATRTTSAAPVIKRKAATTRVRATAKEKATATPAARAKPKPAPAATSKGKVMPAAKGKVTPVAKAKANATRSAKANAKATPGTKAKPKTRRAPAGTGGAPARSLQSATAPRAAGDRSRKPGATSQAHQLSTPRTSQPPAPRRSAPPPAEPAGAVGTAVQAAAELTEIGLKASARALRGALSRLPRP